MKYMAVVECVSSGRLYIDDIISHGYKPLIINLNIHTEDMDEYRKLIAKGIGDKADYIDGEMVDMTMEELAAGFIPTMWISIVLLALALICTLSVKNKIVRADE